MSEPSKFDLLMNPAKYGYEVCAQCNGYGSSLKEEAPRCTQCQGLGLVKKKEVR